MSPLLFVALAIAAPSADESVPQWGRFEAAFTAAEDTSPDAEFAVEFTSPSDRRRTVPGFWDGGRTWRVRFLPDEEGTWRFRSRAKRDTGLDGQAGRFVCRKPAARTTNPLLRHGPVVVSSNGRHLQHLDGTPFFWLADTVWTGPALSAKDDWDTYLEDRAKKHFSAVQFNALCPWCAAAADAEGKTAFSGEKKVRINPDYFRRLDARIDAINAHGLLAAPVLIWANKADDPGNALPEADIIKLLRYQVARYGAHHVLWILAGDNDYKGAQGEKWRRIGNAVFGDNRHPAPVTTHPTGMNWPWADWRDEGWLTVLGYQSGHGDSPATLRWIHSGPPSDGWRKRRPGRSSTWSRPTRTTSLTSRTSRTALQRSPGRLLEPPQHADGGRHLRGARPVELAAQARPGAARSQGDRHREDVARGARPARQHAHEVRGRPVHVAAVVAAAAVSGIARGAARRRRPGEVRRRGLVGRWRPGGGLSAGGRRGAPQDGQVGGGVEGGVVRPAHGEAERGEGRRGEVPGAGRAGLGAGVAQGGEIV